MQHNHNQGPPFSDSEVGFLMTRIALGMFELNENVIHRDLKASNVLVCFSSYGVFGPIHGRITCDVADFEGLVGVVGAGYWRAPKILCAMQHQCMKSQLFTKKADSYNFAMTCYEILMGCVLFEDLSRNCYNIVIEGRRPEIPKYIDPTLKTLLSKGWHVDPSKDLFEVL